MLEVDWRGEHVRALRAAMRRSRYEFARLVGVTPRTVGLWENGRTTRMHDASRRLLDRVLAEADAEARARFAQAIAEPEPKLESGLDKEVEDDVRRRELLTYAGIGIAGQAAALVAAEPERMLAALDAGSISERRLLVLEETATHLGTRAVQVPPRELLPGALEQFRIVRGCLAERQTTAAQARLVRTAGRLATVVGEILFNDGHFGQAKMWYTTAAHAAQDIGDRYTEDIALAGAGYLPTYSDRPRDVLALLAPRLAEDPGRGPAVAWLWSLAARAHAELGAAEDFARCIDRAAAALADATAAEMPLGIFSFRPEKLAFYRAIGSARLGLVDQTAEAASAALAAYDPSETMEPALVRFEHATALLAGGEVEEACAVATAAITGPNTYIGLTVAKRARRFDATLGTRRGAAVTEWRDRMTAATGTQRV